ncbi:outer membrane protein [Klebsiella oxytoca]|nr:outer membrane protein [Klebsiella oxytoca]
MEPLSRRGYAPEIRGIARTSARFAVRQSGNLIYETTVSPGAFVIDDLYPTGYGGDLDVTVYEATAANSIFRCHLLPLRSYYVRASPVMNSQ